MRRFVIAISCAATLAVMLPSAGSLNAAIYIHGHAVAVQRVGPVEAPTEEVRHG
jgi:hypothetical protein